MSASYDGVNRWHLGQHGRSAVRQPHRQSMLLDRVQAPANDDIAARSFLSVIIPAKNESASLPQLMAEITSALRPLCWRAQGELEGFEIIIVDDGSTDATQSVLEQLAVDHPELTWLALAEPIGQSAAIMMGIEVARGQWIATLDADLQNVPADLVRLWRVRSDRCAVLGWRVKRRDIWSKRMISLLANNVRNLVLKQSIRDTGCSVRLFPREVALRLPRFQGMHRFFGSLLLREGCELIQRPVRHRVRFHGRSHYGFWDRALHVTFDLFGVAWLMDRSLCCRTTKSCDSPSECRDASAGILQHRHMRRPVYDHRPEN